MKNNYLNENYHSAEQRQNLSIQHAFDDCCERLFGPEESQKMDSNHA